jgi:hypothetical protein
VYLAGPQLLAVIHSNCKVKITISIYLAPSIFGIIIAIFDITIDFLLHLCCIVVGQTKWKEERTDDAKKECKESKETRND